MLKELFRLKKIYSLDFKNKFSLFFYAEKTSLHLQVSVKPPVSLWDS